MEIGDKLDILYRELDKQYENSTKYANVAPFDIGSSVKCEHAINEMIWTFGEIKNDLPTDQYNPFWDEKKLKETKGGESLEDILFSVEDVRIREREYREKI